MRDRPVCGPPQLPPWVPPPQQRQELGTGKRGGSFVPQGGGALVAAPPRAAPGAWHLPVGHMSGRGLGEHRGARTHIHAHTVTQLRLFAKGLLASYGRRRSEAPKGCTTNIVRQRTRSQGILEGFIDTKFQQKNHQRVYHNHCRQATRSARNLRVNRQSLYHST
jgi:hypothetical protein